jgi:hypothetical protein
MNFHPAALDFIFVTGCVAALSIYFAFVVERIDQAWSDSQQDRNPSEVATADYRGVVRAHAEQE